MQKYLELLKNQIILDIKERLCYRINLISDLVLFTLIYVAVFYLAASGESTAESRFLTLLGYIFWQFNAMALGYSTSTIRLEASRGTLELYIQSKYSIILLMGIRLMISLMISAVTMSGILVFSIAVHILNFSNLVFFLKALVLIVPSIIGMYGIGLMIGAVGLGEKNTGQMVMIIQGTMLFLINMIQTEKFSILHLLPFAPGIVIVQTLYSGQPISALISLGYVGLNLLWLAAGVSFFNVMLERERRYGSFDHY